MGGGVLRALSCSVDLAGRHCRRFLWPSPDVHLRCIHLCRSFRMVWLCARYPPPDCSPCFAGNWWSAAGSGEPRHHQCDVPNRRARQSDWHMVRIYWHHSGDRSGAGRMAGSASFLALGVLYQPADCRGGDCHLIFVCPRESWRAGQSKARRNWSSLDHSGIGLSRVRHDRSSHSWLD